MNEVKFEKFDLRRLADYSVGDLGRDLFYLIRTDTGAVDIVTFFLHDVHDPYIGIVAATKSYWKAVNKVSGEEYDFKKIKEIALMQII